MLEILQHFAIVGGRLEITLKCWSHICMYVYIYIYIYSRDDFIVSQQCKYVDFSPIAEGRGKVI